ncbi:MAG: hypothetical protein IPL46_33850 [Saprospiraceae bacterium]|nr:hypothetical protein [Saprospiraceae bacterium]
MEFNPNNNVVRLCLEGMGMEEKGKPGEASKLFIQAWNVSSNDSEKFIAFLSRSYHESIKNGMPYLAKKVIVKNGSFTSEEDIKEPILVNSRPKGE